MMTGKMVRLDLETHRLLCNYRDTLRACVHQKLFADPPDYLSSDMSLSAALRYLLENRKERFNKVLEKVLENWEGEIQ